MSRAFWMGEGSFPKRSAHYREHSKGGERLVKRVVHQKAKGPIDPSMGQKVRELRMARGMTQADLAGDYFTKGFVSLVENGRTRMSLRATEVVAARLGVTAADLMPRGAKLPREAAKLVFSPGLSKEMKDAVRHADQVAAITDALGLALRRVFRDYSRSKEAIGKVGELLKKAPEPNFSPADAEAWKKEEYLPWLRDLRNAFWERTPSSQRRKKTD